MLSARTMDAEPRSVVEPESITGPGNRASAYPFGETRRRKAGGIYSPECSYLAVLSPERFRGGCSFGAVFVNACTKSGGKFETVSPARIGEPFP